MAITELEGKGRAVIATERIEAGSYICEYEREAVYPLTDRPTHEKEYAGNGEGCMILDILTVDGWLCLDATRSHDTVGRLLNHAPARYATARAFKPLQIDGEWRVGFLATRAINIGEEITWDYGCPSEGQEWLMRTKRPGMKSDMLANAVCFSCAFA